MKTSLASYRRLKGPTKTIFDLGQSAEAGRARTDLKHGELPTLATTTGHLWCPDLDFSTLRMLFPLIWVTLKFYYQSILTAAKV